MKSGVVMIRDKLGRDELLKGVKTVVDLLFSLWRSE